MTQALSIGASGVNADMTAIDALAENIANAQTPGYISESATLSAIPGGAVQGVGSGVEVTSVAQATNALLSANNWQAQGALSNLSALQETLTAIENVFPLATQPASSGTATSSASISGQLSTFWSAWDAVASSPSTSAPRLEVLDDAQGIVTALHEASTQLSQIAQNAVTELTGQVSQVNTLATQVANLNRSILAVSGNGSTTAPMEDQLQEVLGTLSQLAGVDVRMQANGTATVSIGGISLVQGDTASTLRLATTGGEPPMSVELEMPSGSTIPVPVSSGSIAGLLSSVNTYIPTAEGMLNSVATALATTVNGELQSAYTATGAPAVTPTTPTTSSRWEMFVGTSAAEIEVNSAMVAQPTRIAVSSSSTPAASKNNGGVAQTMAELGTAVTAPDAKYRTLVQSLGAITQSVNDQMEAQTAVATQATQALQAVTGVDITDDLTMLIGFQQNYEASAKVLSTVDTTVQALLQAV